MLILILVFLIALAVSSLSTPFVMQLAVSLGWVDAPAKRKLHQKPMPLMGGIAILSAAFIAFSIAWIRGNTDLFGILISGTLIAIVGLIDDRWPLNAPLKFGFQALAFILVIAFGYHTRLPIPDVFDYIVTFLWLAIITNATNFLDNMDGLCAGVCAVACAYIMVIASLNDQYLIAPLAAAVLGACLGFLRYNFNPAKIFMGDAGSLFLGFLIAIMSLQLRFPENSNFVTWMIPPLLLGVPLFDLALISISRLRRGLNPLTAAGKDHTSHRLVLAGLTQREAVFTIYLMGSGF